MGTVRTYDEGTSYSLSEVQRVGFPEDIPSTVLLALCTEDLLGASSTGLLLFSPFFPPGNFVGRIKGAKCPFDLQFLTWDFS